MEKSEMDVADSYLRDAIVEHAFNTGLLESIGDESNPEFANIYSSESIAEVLEAYAKMIRKTRQQVEPDEHEAMGDRVESPYPDPQQNEDVERLPRRRIVERLKATEQKIETLNEQIRSNEEGLKIQTESLLNTIDLLKRYLDESMK